MSTPHLLGLPSGESFGIFTTSSPVGYNLMACLSKHCQVQLSLGKNIGNSEVIFIIAGYDWQGPPVDDNP